MLIAAGVNCRMHLNILAEYEKSDGLHARGARVNMGVCRYNEKDL